MEGTYHLSPCTGCGVFKRCRCFGLLFCSWWVKSLPFLFGTSWKIQVDSGQETMRFLFPGIMPRLDHGIFRDSTLNTGMYPFWEMYLWWKLATQQAIDNSDSGNSEGDELLYDIACFTHPMISPCGFESKNKLQNMVQISVNINEIENKLGFNGISYNYQYLSIVRSPVPFRSVKLPKSRSVGIDWLFAKVTANADVKNSIILVHPTCGPTQPGDIDGPTRHLATGTSSCCFSNPAVVGWAADFGAVLVNLRRTNTWFFWLLRFYFEILW